MPQKKLNRLYSKALKDLNKEIKAYMDKFDELTRTEQYALSRNLDTVKRIDKILRDLNEETQLTVYDFVKDSAIDGYLKTMYDIEKDIKLNVDFNILSKDYIERLVNKKVEGKTFSQRLYNHRRKLASAVKSELLDGSIQGKGYRVIAKNIAEQTEANYNQALRIARTEGGRVQTETTQKAYEEAEGLGIKIMKQWVASLDDTTRDEHADLDGQTVGIDEEFEIDGYSAIGPRMFGEAEMDINCRCSTIVIVNGINPKLRMDNKSKEHIENQTYKEWKKGRG